MSEATSPQVCRICGKTNHTQWYVAKEMMFGFRDPFRYFQCEACQCLQIEKFPENISRYYPSNYYSLAQNDEIKFHGFRGKLRRLSVSALVFNSKSWHKLVQKFYSPISLRVLRHCHVSRATRILDVGCGSGHKFLYPLAELGFKNIAGCDPFLEKDIGYGNGLKIFKSDIFGMTGEWDIITFHHVFEHVPDPLANLGKVAQLLDRSGVCILRMPTVSSYAWEHYRTYWVQLDAPRHYYLHSIKSVEILAAKVGMELFKVEFDSTYKQFADSEKYLQDEHLRQPRKRGFFNFIRRKMHKIKYRRMADDMNRQQKGDQAAFFLRKTNIKN